MELMNADQTILISKDEFARKASMCAAFMAQEFGGKDPLRVIDLVAKFCAVLTYALYDEKEEKDDE